MIYFVKNKNHIDRMPEVCDEQKVKLEDIVIKGKKLYLFVDAGTKSQIPCPYCGFLCNDARSLTQYHLQTFHDEIGIPITTKQKGSIPFALREHLAELKLKRWKHQINRNMKNYRQRKREGKKAAISKMPMVQDALGKKLCRCKLKS